MEKMTLGLFSQHSAFRYQYLYHKFPILMHSLINISFFYDRQ